MMLRSHLGVFLIIVVVFAASGCASPTPTTTDAAAATTCFAIEEFVEGLPHTRGWRTNPALADVDRDGDLDLAAMTRKGQDPTVFLYAPDGWRPQIVSLGSVPCGVGVRLTDLTADGLLDLLVADHCSGLFIFKGDGKGTFNPFARMGTPAGEGFNDAAAGDLNGDGLIDIIALGSFSRGYTVFMGEGPGEFVYVKSTLPRRGFGWDVHLEDLNGDGRLDIFGTLQGFKPGDREDGARPGKVWLQEEGGTWTQGQGFPERGNWFGIARGDFDEDGKPDFAMSNRDNEGGIRVYRGESPAFWAESNHLGNSYRRLFSGVMVLDMDGDGHEDIVGVEHRTPSVVVWLGDGRGSFIECPDRPPPIDRIDRPGWGITGGDVDHNGSTEVIVGFGTELGGALKAWSYKPTGKRPAATPAAADANVEARD